MKTILITLVVAIIAGLVAIKEDTAEALFHAFICGCVIGFFTVCAWVEGKLQLNRIKRIREDNRLRRERVINRGVVIKSLAKEFEVVRN